MTEFPYVWAWDRYPCFAWNLPEGYKGKRCRLLVTSTRMNSAAIEFEDGYRTITSRNGLKRAKEGDAPSNPQLTLLEEEE
jgi:hypothetical protein